MALNIYDRRERVLVRAADALLLPLALRRALRHAPSALPRRILCLRLERIGDLLMTLPALAALRAAVPDAEIDLVVGSWNRDLAAAIPGVSRVETLDAAWLSRETGGRTPLGVAAQAAAWRARHYDLGINFEPDIRTNLAIAASGAAWTIGFRSGGGGSLLDMALDYDARAHTADNALALVQALFGESPLAPDARLAIPESARSAAMPLLPPRGAGPTIGIHVSAGRLVKQWPEDRFHEVAERLIRARDARLVFTGAPGDRPQIDSVKAGLPPDRCVDISGTTDLLTVAAVLQQLDLLVTVDTGPMHLAHAVGTPIVAIFGPSDPQRYAPRGVHDVVVRIDLPCSPCNRIRLPPARCTGHTPDCLAGIEIAPVMAGVDEVLKARAR